MMETQWVGAHGPDGRASKRELALMSRSPSQRKRLARRLGWAGIALGLVQLSAPGMLTKTMGVTDSRRARWTLLACGLREVTTGVGVVASSRPNKWMWARIVGDLVDMALLGSASRSRRSSRDKIAWTFGLVTAVALMDVIALRRLGGGEATSDAGLDRDRMKHTRAVTILASRGEVERYWQSFQDEKPRKHGAPSFSDAPGHRGTEVRVQTSKLRARAVEAKLRRLKQMVEAGEVIQSDASIHRGRHAAKPSKHVKIEPSGRELLR